MKTKFLTSLIISIVISFTANAGITDVLFGKKKLAGPCKKTVAVPKNLSLPELKQEAYRLKQQDLYCESAAYFLKIMNEATSAQDYSLFWKEAIESYFFQYDYENMIQEASIYLQQRPNSSQSENVHYLMARATYELFKTDPQLGNPWLQLALGTHPEQLNPDSDKRFHKLRYFLQSYPNSVYTTEIESYLQEIKHDFSKGYWEEAHLLLMKREYAPAIVRYQFLINQGPDSAQFALSFYEMLLTLHEFAYTITNEKVLFNEKIARWFTLPPEKITQELRLQVKQQLLEQAHKVKQKMLESLPNDPWTQKAMKDFP